MTQHISPAKRLKEHKDLLIKKLFDGKSGDFLHGHAQIVDDYFRSVFETSTIGPQMQLYKNPYAIIALGGYGRRELCVNSDIDLLIIFEKSIPKEAEELVREIVYPLWDIGYDVGYSTRSLKDCVKIAKEDFEVFISMLDARFLCGMSLVHHKLLDLVNEKLILKHSKTIINWLIENNENRHAEHGDATYRLEPNLKEGQGGLRDYHTMLWIARIKSNLKQPRDLEYYGYLSSSEFEELNHALYYIWGLRNRLHLMTGRKCDQLYLEYQINLSEQLEYKTANGQQPVERFLGDLHGQMEYIKNQYFIFLYELGLIKKPKFRKQEKLSTTIPGLMIDKEMLTFSNSEKILDSPELIIQIFEESVRLRLPLRAEAKRLVKEFSFLVDDTYRKSSLVIRSFENILTTRVPQFDVLEEMLSTGFLKMFIPEIDSIENRIQYDAYHLFPVDKHSLYIVQTLKNFAIIEKTSKDRLYRDLYKEIKKPEILLWAALLHDIGKGESGQDHATKGAIIARQIMARMGYSDSDVETVAFLVKEHLFLIKIATRRDINDEETAIYCARRIKTIENLKMLYLLTIADSMSTGPKAWNEWNNALLHNLFFKIFNIIDKGELASQLATETVEQKKLLILEHGPKTQLPQETESLLNMMSPRYLLYAPVTDIIEHIELYHRLKDQKFVWSVSKSPSSNTRTVTICAKDRIGLFSKIAGTFTLNNLNILDAQIYTWRNNTALDIFEVDPPLDKIFEQEKWEKARQDLQNALDEKIEFEDHLKQNNKLHAYDKPLPGSTKRPNRVVINNDTSSFFTIIEVFTHDSPGLLYRITHTIAKCDLDIRIAKISTKVDQVVDVFYVRDKDGQKVDQPDLVSKIQEAILDILPSAERLAS